MRTFVLRLASFGSCARQWSQMGTTVVDACLYNVGCGPRGTSYAHLPMVVFAEWRPNIGQCGLFEHMQTTFLDTQHCSDTSKRQTLSTERLRACHAVSGRVQRGGQVDRIAIAHVLLYARMAS